MIDLSDFIIKQYARKDNRKDKINNQKLYRFTCNECSKDRGYLRKSSPDLCGSCSAKSDDQVEQLLKNRIRNNLRARLYRAIKGNFKAGSAVGDLGCSIEDFKLHIERQFKPGMNWGNWSKTGWHIDHIVPLDVFDLTNREDIKKVCHYSNLQPLWSKENLSKGNKLLDDIIIEITK